jgi:hypothetical protein
MDSGDDVTARNTTTNFQGQSKKTATNNEGGNSNAPRTPAKESIPVPYYEIPFFSPLSMSSAAGNNSTAGNNQKIFNTMNSAATVVAGAGKSNAKSTVSGKARHTLNALSSKGICYRGYYEVVETVTI